MKKLVHQVLDEEMQNQQLSVRVQALMNFELYHKKSLRNFNIYDKMINYLHCDSSQCFYNRKKNLIAIILDNFWKLSDRAEQIYELLFSILHEARHVKQKTFDTNSYEGILYFIDNVIGIDDFDYEFVAHNSYSFEIGANLYSIRKTSEYMQQHFPDEYVQIKPKIDMLENIYCLEYLSYNLSKRFDKFIPCFQYCIKNKIVRWNNQLEDINQLNNSIIPDVFMTFFQEDGTLKNITEIINNENFDKVDKRISYALLSSTLFLKKLDINNLEHKQLVILREALEYTIFLTNQQRHYIECLHQAEYNLYVYQKQRAKFFLEKISIFNSYLLDEILRHIHFRSCFQINDIYIKKTFLKKIKQLKI